MPVLAVRGMRPLAVPLLALLLLVGDSVPVSFWAGLFLVFRWLEQFEYEGSGAVPIGLHGKDDASETRAEVGSLFFRKFEDVR